MKTKQSNQSGPSPEAVTEKPRRVASGMKIFEGACGAQFGVPDPIYECLVEFAREVWWLARVRAVGLERTRDP